MNNQAPLVVTNLSKNFISRSWLPWKAATEFAAVNNISFTLNQGEILGFLGPNGAGKTTTIHMLLNALTPTSGRIMYFGSDLTSNKKAMKKVAYTSGYQRMPSTLTVRQNLFMYGMLYNMPSLTLKNEIFNVLAACNIEHLADKKASTLSAGQATAVLIARTFLVRPQIILLDEPTTSLDPITAHNIRLFIQTYNKQYGASILFTSHNMAEVADLCDRVIIIQNGSIIANNTPEQLAGTVSIARVQLMVGDGLKRTVAYAEEKKFAYRIEGRHIEIDIDEHKIAALLSELATRQVQYTQISIDKPSLEDYFLSLYKGD